MGAPSSRSASSDMAWIVRRQPGLATAPGIASRDRTGRRMPMKRWAVIASIAAATAIVGGVAYATIPDSDGVIHGCYASSGGLRVVDAGQGCLKSETSLDWNQRGPAGAQGDRGPEGPPGPAGAAAPSPDAVDGTIEITGQRQGPFSKSPLTITAVSHEIVSPRDPASGLPTGKRQHKPFVITKELDKATPLLYNVLVNNENITEWSLEFWKPSPQGAENQHYTIDLVNANIASIRSEMLNNKYPENMQHSE